MSQNGQSPDASADGNGSGSAASWILQVRSQLERPAPKRLPPSDVRQAAVLVPLYVDAGQLWTVLTKRTDHLPSHKGQIAFPGGKLEDGEDLWTGALREAQEEIGLDPERVLRLGQLDEAGTPSGFRIVPCVGAVPYPLETNINQDEIEDVFPVPLQNLSNPDLVEDRRVLIDGVERELRIYHVGRRQIWGLTARILQTLLVRLGVEDPRIGS
ncbi:MAG: CoA pyrophosphatase [Thermoanaerobaculia bacterium]|nr:CoA pyrophosphatase [Thermoanaerobaculia bacterium]